MAYTLPSDADSRGVAIDGAGTLGRRIASVYAAAGSDVRIFDVSQGQREAARDHVRDQVDRVRTTLHLDPSRTGR